MTFQPTRLRLWDNVSGVDLFEITHNAPAVNLNTTPAGKVISIDTQLNLSTHSIVDVGQKIDDLITGLATVTGQLNNLLDVIQKGNFEVTHPVTELPVNADGLVVTNGIKVISTL